MPLRFLSDSELLYIGQNFTSVTIGLEKGKCTYFLFACALSYRGWLSPVMVHLLI